MNETNDMKDLQEKIWKEFAEAIDARIIDNIMESMCPEILRFTSAIESHEFKQYNYYYPTDESETRIRLHVEEYKLIFHKTMFPTML